MGANEIVDLYLEGFKTFQPQTFHFLNILIGEKSCFFCQNSGHNLSRIMLTIYLCKLTDKTYTIDR